MTGQGGVPSSGVSAVALTATALNQTTSGYLTIWPSDQTRPTNVASLNIPTTGATSELVEAKVSAADGTVTIYNAAGSVDVLFDVVGWYGSASGGRYQPINSVRLMDTRSTSRTGTCSNGCITMAANSTMTLHVAGQGGVPATDATAVALNITAANGSVGGYLTAWASDQAQPQTTNVSFGLNQTIADSAIVKLGGDGSINLYNATGTVDVFVDLQGFYVQPDATASYTYNGDGLRTSKTVNGTVTNFTWDESGALPQLSSDSTYTYVYGPDGTPLEQVSGTTVSWLHHDREGTTRLLTTLRAPPSAPPPTTPTASSSTERVRRARWPTPVSSLTRRPASST